jgi:hypothetical protein
MAIDVSALLKATSERRLNDAEVDSVARELASGQADDPYSSLLLIGRASAIRHRELVETFLDRHGDPMLVRLALQILCKFWEFTPDYVDRVVGCMQRSDWDEEDDARQMAFSIAGEYLRAARNAKMLAELLRVVNDNAEGSVLRGDAYLALARAMGKEWTELPKPSRLPPIEQLVDRNVINAAEQRMDRETVS